MPQKGIEATPTSGGRSATPDPFLHGSDRLSPATTSNEEDNVWLRQGRARAQTRESTRATRLTHPHTTPPSNKQNSTAQHTEPSPAAQRGQTKTAQAQQRANGPVTVASQVRRPSSNVAPEPLPEVGPVPSSTTDAGAPDSTTDDNKDQEQAAAEQEHDYASVRGTWEARETEAAVDEARRETSSLELRKDRDVIASLSQPATRYFGNVKGLRKETDDSLYQAAVTIAVALDHERCKFNVQP